MPTSTRDRPLATCAKGLEGLLAEELLALGASNPGETVGGVYFDAGLPTLYRICLWSRLASRVLHWVATVPADDADALYAGVRGIEWDQHLLADGTFAIAFQGRSRFIKTTQFGTLRTKDAIADWFNERHGRRPSVATTRPDLRIHVRLRGGEATVRLDLSGEPMHRRGYRLQGGAAPLKENLAAALLVRAGWPETAAAGGCLIDPMCGSGTFLIEAALMALDRAPGLERDYWGFNGWLGHVPRVWKDLIAEARERAQAASARPDIFGYDGDIRAVRGAEGNIESAGLQAHISVRYRDLSALAVPTHKPIKPGLLITNPPYGERLGETEALVPLYRALGNKLREHFHGWKAAVFTGNPDLGKTMGLRAARRYQFLNGSIESKLLLFEVSEKAHVDAPPPASSHAQGANVAVTEDALSEGARMLANRLRKNLKQLKRWRAQNGITCFRIYDADMPEYAAAIDSYDGALHVAEYQAPTSVSPQAAEQRLNEVMQACSQVFQIPMASIALKQRSRQRDRHQGGGQYTRIAASGEVQEVREGQARLLVNLRDYLDTGLFLDHRKVRHFIGEHARNKRFLNLFCYTGAATVHAALGGARFTTSIDLSATYLDWARRNFAANGLSEQRHRLVRADVMEWLAQSDERYELVFVDPPTFSNSKRTDRDFDVQRDHAALLEACKRILTEDGLIIFSNNRRQFELDPAVQRRFAAEDRTRWSLDADFTRTRVRRHCWFLRQPAR